MPADKQVLVRMPPALQTAAKKAADAAEVTLSAYIRGLIEKDTGVKDTTEAPGESARAARLKKAAERRGEKA